MPPQAANATTINPGITRRAKERPPLIPARNILLIVLVESPAQNWEHSVSCTHLSRGNDCFGAIQTYSIRCVSSLDDQRRSSDTPIFLSAWGAHVPRRRIGRAGSHRRAGDTDAAVRAWVGPRAVRVAHRLHDETARRAAHGGDRPLITGSVLRIFEAEFFLVPSQMPALLDW
jgi:hypothetical protein